MAGLLGYALAGGLAGYGNSLVEEAKAKREAAMEELRNSRLMEREDRDRSFRTSEREASQGFTAGQNEANRAQTREMGGTLLSGPGGSWFRERGGVADEVVGTDGNPVRGLTQRPDTITANQKRNFYTTMTDAYDRFGSVGDVVDQFRDSGLSSNELAAWARPLLRQETPAGEDPNAYADAELAKLGLVDVDDRPTSPAAPATSPTATQSTQQPDAPPPSTQGSEGGDNKPPPGYPDAKKALDGQWYVQKDGKWHRIVAQ